MPSLPGIEILNNNEKLRKSSSYVFRNASRRDSVIAKEFSESERNDSRRTSFNAPIKRRNSRYNIYRTSRDESIAGSFEHIQDFFTENVSISASLLIQSLEIEDRKYICLNLDNIKKLLVESGLKVGPVSIRNLVGHSYLVYESAENQPTFTEDQGEYNVLEIAKLTYPDRLTRTVNKSKKVCNARSKKKLMVNGFKSGFCFSLRNSTLRVTFFFTCQFT
jgi:hypothetical protein